VGDMTPYSDRQCEAWKGNETLTIPYVSPIKNNIA